MQPHELKALVDKYYEGLTSLKEEARLLDELRKSSDSDLYADVIQQLGIMQKMKGVEIPDMQLVTKILSSISQEQPAKKRWTLMGSHWSGIAAAVVLFFALWIGSELVKPSQVYGTITDPKLAFNETTRVLEKVSQNLNKGLEPAQKSASALVQGVEKAESVVGKSEEKNKITKASQYLNSFTRVYINLGQQKNIKN